MLRQGTTDSDDLRSAPCQPHLSRWADTCCCRCSPAHTSKSKDPPLINNPNIHCEWLKWAWLKWLRKHILVQESLEFNLTFQFESSLVCRAHIASDSSQSAGKEKSEKKKKMSTLQERLLLAPIPLLSCTTNQSLGSFTSSGSPWLHLQCPQPPQCQPGISLLCLPHPLLPET